jgi:hypothetical protein
MGIGQWAWGNGHGELAIKEAAVSDVRSNTILSMPHALCPLPNSHSPNNKFVNILYKWVWKNFPLRLTIKMRRVDKTLIST